MRYTFFFSAAVLLLACVPARAKADTFQFSFSGPGVGGSLAVTYGSASDAKYPNALEVTGISGTFSDASLGITNAAVTGLVPVNYASPEPTNLLAPKDFSHFTVDAGTEHGFISYDNLLWPGGSPQTATDYPFHGGFLDIYGLLFNIGNGEVVNLWSNGTFPGTDFNDYGVTVSTSALQLDALQGGVSVTPEPGTLLLLGTGVVGAFLRRRF